MTHSPTGDGPTLEQRIAAMEAAIGQLIGRMTRLEDRLAERSPADVTSSHSSRAEPVVAPPPVLPPRRQPPQLSRFSLPGAEWRALDLEQILGRYGAIGFALLALLAGVGTFVSWAARQGLLGPELRVAGGYLLAGALAVAGVRLRESRRTFANALLACALACVHAASWGAGPELHLVSAPVALAIVAAASAALSWLAIREEEDVLFFFGAAGAAVAPFVLSEEGGAPMTLALYGVLVYLAAARGVGARPWDTAVRLVLWTVSPYLVALTALGDPRVPADAAALPALAMGLWAAALLTDAMHAPRFARWGAIALLAAALELRGLSTFGGAAGVALALVGSVGAQFLFARADRMSRGRAEAPRSVQLLPVFPRLALDRGVLDGVVLPLAGLLVVTAATPLAWVRLLDGNASTVAMAAAGWALLWAVAAAFAAVRGDEEPRGAHWMSTVIGALIVGTVGALARSVAVAVPYALGSALALGWWWRTGAPRRALDGAIVMLCIAAAITTSELAAHMELTIYGAPFTTRATALAALTLGAGLALGAVTRMRGDEAMSRGLSVGAAIFAFVWGLTELDVAWSRDLSNALLTLYVGVCGALAIHVGQSRSIELLRRVGLALGGWCAVRTFVLAGNVESLPLRVGLYFLAAGVGLVMAWMYTGGRNVKRDA